jgi:Na+/H+ antiporter NhaD/arsenite permease-like protein
MDNWQAIASLIVFISVIIVIAGEWLHLTIAALLGALVLVFLKILSLQEAVTYISRSHGTLALFFGVMVMVRCFEPTQIFTYLGTRLVRIAKGQGKRLLLGIVGLTTPICAVLPNATTVMLLAPLIPPIAEDLQIDPVPLLILMVFVANSAGLLTLVGDPATFIVGDAINISFIDYLKTLSFGGVLAIAVIICLLPYLFTKIWHSRLEDLSHLPDPPIQHPRLLALGGFVVGTVLLFFVIGELLPTPLPPASVALLGAALCLMISHYSKIDTPTHILRDVDWSTLIFFMCTFVLIGGLEKTGVIKAASILLAVLLGKNLILGTILFIAAVGAISSVVPNIPLVVAMVPLLKEYVVATGMAPNAILAADYTGNLPEQVLPLFYAMMYGATLGGNGTLVGASSNIVAAGIAEQYGHTIGFHRFLRYSLPVASLQVVVLGLFVLICYTLPTLHN